MAREVSEYRYRTSVRRHAILWCGLSIAAFVGLATILTLRWSEFGWSSRVLACVLLLILIFTIRAQLGRVFYRLLIEPEILLVIAPLANRTIRWAQIIEVRRTTLVAVGKQRWACTLRLRNATGSSTPVFIFDDQLNDAEAALQQIVRLTPHAQHVLA